MEVWKNIIGYENYQVSSLGNVKKISFEKEIIKKSSNDGNGYLQISLYKKGNRKSKRVHQLVAESFLNHIPCKQNLVVNHKNFIRTDNRVENLEIVSTRENTNQKHLKSTSKYTGVHWSINDKKWMSRILINKKRKYLGLFDTELEAHNAYQNELINNINNK